MYEIGLTLAFLIIAQSLALFFLVGPRVPRLGFGGARRVAVRFAIASVLLDGFLLAWAFPTHAWH